MRLRFVLRLFLFAAPIALVLSVPVALAIHMGESMPIRAVVALQMGEAPVLYGPADREPILAYKLMAIQTRRPEVLFIGSSRILQFRAQFLNRNSAAFYNAGGEGWGMDEIRTVVEQLDRDHAPRVMVVGLDQVWFNREYVNWEEPPELNTGELSPSRVIGGTRKLIDLLLGEDIALDAVIERREQVRGATGLGLNALRFGRGYRNDGSHQEGDLLAHPELGELARTHDLEAAPDGWRQFAYGNDVSEPMIARLDSLLQLAQDKGITVVGLAPPYMPSIYDLMMSGGKTGYLPKASAQIEAVFARHGFDYFDVSDAARVGGTDELMYDGWHPTELLSLTIYIAMLKALPDIFGAYSDLKALEQEASQAENPLEVFDGRT